MLNKILRNFTHVASTLVGFGIIICALISVFKLGVTWDVALTAITVGTGLIFGFGAKKKVE